MFIVTWLAALLIWRYGQIEEKWTGTVPPAGDLDEELVSRP
jgi:high-affinity nickel-transport protein